MRVSLKEFFSSPRWGKETYDEDHRRRHGQAGWFASGPSSEGSQR